MILISRRALVCLGFALFAMILAGADTASPAPMVVRTNVLEQLVPKPRQVLSGKGVFSLQPSAALVVPPSVPEVARIATDLAVTLRRATGYALPIVRTSGWRAAGSLALRLGGESRLGNEGYELTISPTRVTLVAHRPAGLFYGTQTIRQLFPAAVESRTARQGPWALPAGTIRDVPRFPWRGVMLDVARHFFSVADVEHLVESIARYKLNRLHLHLSDDQGWRIQIRSRPRLTTHGAQTAVGGGRGGYYTQQQYKQIVAYARRRYVTVVPEIDMPGHVTAALSSYPSLTCKGEGPALYTAVGITGNSLCVRKESTYSFLDDVLRELAALTPGRYIHIGGDEATGVTPAEYAHFIERAQAIVARYGKRAIGWGEIASTKLRATTVVQHWWGGAAAAAAKHGAKLIMSPADHAYLDQKYDPSTRLGLSWAGYVSVEDAYRWEPASVLPGVRSQNVLGVEAPLWTETITSRADLDYMVFPRLIGIAEIGWSAKTGRNWNEYRVRLGGQAARLAATGINFYRSPEVPWR